MSYALVNGVNVATDDINRDGVTEKIQLFKPTDKLANELFPTTDLDWAASAAAAAAKAGSGRFFGASVVAQGAQALTITDGPGGPVLLTIDANGAVGPYPALPGVLGGVPFGTSLYVNSQNGTPRVTLFFT